MRRIIIATAFVFLSTQASYGQAFRAYAGEFLQLGAASRSLALGGTGITYSRDASAGYWNPAGLAELMYPSVTGMHESRFDGTIQHNFGAFAVPLGKNYGASVSLLHIGISDIKDTRSAFVDRNNNGAFDDDDYLDYTKVTSFGNYDWGILFSLGKQHDSLLSYGATFKLILRKLDPVNKATGFGLDVGVKYRAADNLILAATAQDVTTTYLTYSSGTKELVSPTLKVGAAFEWDVTGTKSHVVMPVVETSLRFENRGSVSQVALGPIGMDFHVGTEYRFKNIIALRGGYTDTRMLTFGAGLSLPKLAVDYAFQTFNAQDQLGNTHRVSFVITIEQEKWKRE